MSTRLAKLYSAELDGINARLIEIEVDINAGLHSFNIVGLADKSLNEARERVNSALKNSRIKPPNRENRKITVNLAPADVKKTGSQYDLALALGYLLATGQIKNFHTEDKIFIGELALDGRLRPINGALNIAQLAYKLGYKYIYVPRGNANEAAIIDGVSVIPANTLVEIIADLENTEKIPPASYKRDNEKNITECPDFSEIRGQENAKRAMVIAATGGHNILLIGSPGMGKSLLAQALIGILPDLSLDEAVEITKIYSSAGLSPQGLIQKRPFRSPHHTASAAAIIGGGTTPRPGEISLAHNGILFLDELPEFQRGILESLRQPLETGVVHIARAKEVLKLPANFSLVAAMNPCPCGFYGDEEKECRCSPYEVLKYQKKISGPLLDRIDIQVRVPRVPVKTLRDKGVLETSASIKTLIQKSRGIQKERFKNTAITSNSEMKNSDIEKFIHISASGEKFISGLDRTKISPRSFYRLLKVSQTISDLDGECYVTAEHLMEAFSYKLKDNLLV